jgi:hypothetical protein
VTPANASPDEVARALAHRFRAARDDEWDNDRCDVEATGFLAEMRQRGWSLNPDVDWRRLPVVNTASPETKAAALAEARAALRNVNRPIESSGGTE